MRIYEFHQLLFVTLSVSNYILIFCSVISRAYFITTSSFIDACLVKIFCTFLLAGFRYFDIWSMLTSLFTTFFVYICMYYIFTVLFIVYIFDIISKIVIFPVYISLFDKCSFVFVGPVMPWKMIYCIVQLEIWGSVRTMAAHSCYPGPLLNAWIHS